MYLISPAVSSPVSLDSAESEDGVEISVVAPVFNEADGIAAFVNAVRNVLDRTLDQTNVRSGNNTWELILVDDGSSDGTWDVLRQLQSEDNRIKILRFSRNFGVQAATSAGLRFAGGQAVITMDSDLQHPPELIPELIQRWKEGNQCVYAVREWDETAGTFKLFLSNLFRKVIGSLSPLKMPDGLCDYRLLDRKAVDAVNSMDEQFRFLRGMIFSLGFKQCFVPFKTAPRFTGTTKFSLRSSLGLAFDTLTSFSVAPLRWITNCGLFFAVSSMLYGLYMLAEVLFKGIETPGFPTLIVSITFLGGLQLLALGIIGEYVGRIYLETKHRPLFVIQETKGFDVSRRNLSGNENSENNENAEVRKAA